MNDKKNRSISRTQFRVIESAADIAIGEACDPAYMHTALCQTSLPYRLTKDRILERKNGHIHLRVEAGTAYSERDDAWIELPLPFGAKARLVLIHLNTQAIIKQSPCIEVGDSMTEFFSRVLSSQTAGYLNGHQIRMMKQQLSALAAAEIRFAVGGNLQKQGKTSLISEFDLWFPKSTNQRVLWPSTVTLSLDYFQSLINHAVPLDPRAICSLAHNAMALDIYSWLSQRLYRINAQREIFVPWISLHEQFGLGYSRLRKFREVFLRTLKPVLTQYPEANVRPSSRGLHLKQSSPPIRRIQLLK